MVAAVAVVVLRTLLCSAVPCYAMNYYNYYHLRVLLKTGVSNLAIRCW